MNKELDALEQSENIEILYACESGSRAWGFATSSSDFDVRYIYRRPVNDYVTVFPVRDVIDGHVPGDIMDFSGWDVKKFLYLYSKSNTQCFEWFQSPIVYRANFDFMRIVHRIRDKLWNPMAAYHSYRGMHKHHMNEYCDNPTSKNLIHALRPMLCAMWVGITNTIPKMDIADNIIELHKRGVITDDEGLVLHDFMMCYKLSWTIETLDKVIKFIQDHELSRFSSAHSYERLVSDDQLNDILYNIITT